MRRPLFICAIASVITLFLCMSMEKNALFIFLGAVFFADAVIIFLRRAEIIKFAAVITAVSAVFVLLFEADYMLRVLPSQELYGKQISLRGEVCDYPERSENSFYCTLKNCAVNGEQTPLRVKVYCETEIGAAPGDVLGFSSVKIFDEKDEGTFYYHTLSTKVWLSAYGHSAEMISKYGGNSIIYKIKALRRGVNETISGALPGLHANITAALLTGSSSLLPSGFKTKLRVAGASHIFAVSGMHLSLWSSVIFLVLRKRAKTKVWANAAASVFVLFYIFFTGCSPSVVRAGIMLIAAYAGQSVRRFSDPLNSLGLAALLMLAAEPFMAGNVSLLLSFSAMAAIFTLYPFFEFTAGGKKKGLVKKVRSGAAGAVNTVALSFCILFFTVPVTSSFFGGVSLLSPLSSLLCTLPAEGVMLFSSGAVVFSFLPSVSGFLFRLCSVCCGAVELITEKLSEWDFMYCAVNVKEVVLWYSFTLCVFIAVYFIFNKNGRAAVTFLVLSASFVLVLGCAQTVNTFDRIEIMLPPSGNSTCIAAVFNGSSAALIGTGENYGSAERTSAFLSRNGVSSITTLIIPDGENTEYGQIKYFASGYNIKNVFTAKEAAKFFPDAPVYECAGSFETVFGCGVKYENADPGTLKAGIISCGGFRAVISYSPSNDFSSAPDCMRTGELLICRAGIPKGLDSGDFERVLVMTDKSAGALGLPANAATTADCGGIVYSIR